MKSATDEHDGCCLTLCLYIYVLSSKLYILFLSFMGWEFYLTKKVTSFMTVQTETGTLQLKIKRVEFKKCANLSHAVKKENSEI